MAWKEFKYSYVPFRADLGYRPYLHVQVSIGGESLNIYPIVDSGAQHTLINCELAPLLGVVLDKSTVMVGGVGKGNLPGFETSAILEFLDYNNQKIISPVIFTELPVDMLLGQNAFFKNFNILFQGREGVFKLNKVVNHRDER